MARRRRRTNGWLIIIVVGGGLFAIAAGYLLGTYAMQAFSIGVKNPPEPTPTPGPAPAETPVKTPDPPAEQTSVTIRLPVVTLHHVQIGAFSSRDNARKLASELQQSGLTAYVGSTAPFRVIVGATGDRDSSASLGTKVAQDGYPVYVGQWSLPGGSFTLDGDSDYLEWYDQTMRSMGRLISIEGAMWSALFAGRRPADSELEELESLARQINGEVQSRTVPDGWQNEHDRLEAAAAAGLRSAFEMRALRPDTIADNWRPGQGQFLELITAYELVCAVLAEKAR